MTVFKSIRYDFFHQRANAANNLLFPFITVYAYLIQFMYVTSVINCNFAKLNMIAS